MSSHDCFEMGRQSYLNKDYHHTQLWMNEAMARLNNDTGASTTIAKADILEYLAFSVFKQGTCVPNDFFLLFYYYFLFVLNIVVTK